MFFSGLSSSNDSPLCFCSHCAQTKMSKTLGLPIAKLYGAAILRGDKTQECRRASAPGIRKAEPGMTLVLHWYSGERVEVKINGVQHFPNVKTMLELCENWDALIPGCTSAQEALAP